MTVSHRRGCHQDRLRKRPQALRNDPTSSQDANCGAALADGTAQPLWRSPVKAQTISKETHSRAVDVPACSSSLQQCEIDQHSQSYDNRFMSLIALLVKIFDCTYIQIFMISSLWTRGNSQITRVWQRRVRTTAPKTSKVAPLPKCAPCIA